MAESNSELTVERAFTELRQMFHKGQLRIEVNASEIPADEDSDLIGNTGYVRIVISRATPISAKSFIASTLADAMNQVCTWHRETRQ